MNYVVEIDFKEINDLIKKLKEESAAVVANVPEPVRESRRLAYCEGLEEAERRIFNYIHAKNRTSMILQIAEKG